MSDFVIEAELRNVEEKKAKQLRREGMVPAVIYGQSAPIHIQMNDRDLRRVLRKSGTAELFQLRVGNEEARAVLIKDFQRHVTRQDLLHIDFYEVKAGELLQQEVDLVSVGKSPVGTTLGFIQIMEQSVTIECLPKDLVTHIDVDISMIKTVDDMIFLKDLALPEGVEILGDPDTLIAKFDYAQTEDVDAPEEDLEAIYDADDVEVITAADEDDE
jgi:large subunit ribosomal protein L25